MPLKNGVKRANGGKRKNAGRKPKAITLLKRELIAERGKQAEYALDLFISAMHDASRKDEIRLAAAREVLDRVLGKPAQVVANPGDDLYQAHLARLKAAVFGDELPPDGSGVAAK